MNVVRMPAEHFETLSGLQIKAVNLVIAASCIESAGVFLEKHRIHFGPIEAVLARRDFN